MERPREADDRRIGDGYTAGEELAHVATHGVGLALAATGAAVLIALAVLRGSPRSIAGCVVFGAALVALYGASTLYHGIRSARAKPLLRRFDRAAIYLLIAGTYTPFTLVSLRGAWGWSLLTLVWLLAALGMGIELGAGERARRFSIPLYLAMGWLALAAIEPLRHAVGPGGLRLLVLGGLAYTVGLLFYAWRRIPYNHAVWHLFALAGSTFHFVCVLAYVVPPPR